MSSEASSKNKFKWSYTPIVDLYKSAAEKENNDNVTVKGWIESVRAQSKVIFIHLSDGSHPTPLQLVIAGGATAELRKSIEAELHNGTTMSATGRIVKSPGKGQVIEMVVEKAQILGRIASPATFVPSMKQQQLSIDLVRSAHDLRALVPIYKSIYRIRSSLMYGIHSFFHERHILHLDPNVITKAACEGGAQQFTLAAPANKEGKIPDFFGGPTFLTESSQLQLEALTRGTRAVYTTNPSFRAEPSKTRRHLCSFVHLEWELAFLDSLADLMDFSEDLTSHCFQTVLKECAKDVQHLDQTVAKGLTAKLESFVGASFARMTYDEAIQVLSKDSEKVIQYSGGEFKDANALPKWGDDLGACCERYLAEVVHKKPVFVYNYPRDLKSFYMKLNPSSIWSSPERPTVASCDLLIPGCGELIGSSLRSDDEKELMNEIQRRGMDIRPLQWYVDLRKNATFPHGGDGLGIDRLVSICTSMEGNIRDAVPFPVAFQECLF